jgi:Tetratricopeptide repeat
MFVAGPVQGQQTVRVAGPDHPDSVTFSQHVAPILYQHCVTCHRLGGSAPFPLITYDDARMRAELIRSAVERHYMPPWLPDSGYGDFAGKRGLSPTQIATIVRWVDDGAPRGDSQTAPTPPKSKSEWTLGEPDLVVQLPAYVVPLQGRDVYRNLVVPIPVHSRRYVSAVELRPGNPRVVHHARMMVDTTSSSRRFDAADPTPGFDGMHIESGAEDPPGHFVGWTPGKIPTRGSDDLAWPLDPGTDLVLQIHIRPQGQTDTLHPEVGFYFASSTPRALPAIILLGSYEIDIPPGEHAHMVTDEFTLPVDVDVLSVYPHAHYVGRRIHGIATLPDGSTKWLIRIDEWDFNWQDEYRYAQPVPLPRGTKLTMQWIYDNSADNPRNPNHPPKRVRYGSLSTDEMGDLQLQVLPRKPEDRALLLRDLAWKYQTRRARYSAGVDRAAGDSLAALGRFDEAVPLYQSALQLVSDDASLHMSLARALASSGQEDAAVMVIEHAVMLPSGRDPDVLAVGAQVLSQVGRMTAAVHLAEEALRLAERAGNTQLAQTLRADLTKYRRQGAR